MKFIIGLIVGLLLGSVLVAKASNISVEKIFNKVFDSTNNVLNIKGV